MARDSCLFLTVLTISEGGVLPAEFPSYKSLDFQQEKRLQACLMRRCFTYIDTEHEAVTYIHRTIAEFLGARWLAERIRYGYPLSRILNLIGQDGHPVSELRGLHSWLPVFLHEHANVFIRNDPYGVLMYGDASSLSFLHRKVLLSNLEQLSRKDPWFREGEWSDNQLGALSGSDMAGAFQDILSDEGASFHLRSIVLGSIANGPSLPQMRDTLLEIIISGKIYHEASIAVEALLKVIPDGKKEIIYAFHSSLKQNPKTARLRGRILSRLYENHFQPEDVLSVCSDVLHDTERHAIGELWDLAAVLPEENIPAILNSLCAIDQGKGFDGERTNQHIVEYVFEQLLHRLLLSGFMPQVEKLWQWLSCLQFLGGRYGTGSHNDISSWLKQNQSLVFAMLLGGIEKVDKKKYWQFWSNFEQITMHSLVWEDLIRMVFSKLDGQSELSEIDLFLYEKCGPPIFWLEPESILELLDIFQSLAIRHPALRPVCEACCRCEIEDWRLRDIERNQQEREKKEKQKNENMHNLEQTKDSIVAGKHLNNIGFLARIYFGDFSDIDQSLSPVDRLCETIGQECVDLALSGFAAILERDDLPTPYDVTLSLTENSYFPWWYAVLAGINEAWLRQGEKINGISDDLLRLALTLAIVLPVNGDGEKDRKWKQQLLDERQDIVESVYEEIAQTELKFKKKHIIVLYYLQHNEETKSWRSRVALKLLRQFSCCPPECLESLVLAGLYDPIFREKLIELAKHGIVSCHGEQKSIWLIIGFLFLPVRFAKMLDGYSKRHEQIVWKLRDISQRATIIETDKSLELSIEQIEYCVMITGRVFQKVSRPDSVTMGDKNPWDATEFVHENINKLAALPERKSTEALSRLLANESLISYHDHLRHSLANQAIVIRETEYRQPSWGEAVDSLKGGKPANIGDLYALVVDHLYSMKERIKYGNTDFYKSFWSCDSHGRVVTPEIEDVCRDRLIDLLEPSLIPLDLRVEPEGHMAAEKRADMIILGSGRMKLPIEFKRDFHPDIWTACANQLERMYSRDPGAKGYGIYGVFWFGEKRSSTMRNPPNEIPKPETAVDLEIALGSLVPDEHQNKIKVIVFDVTPPS